MKIGVICFTARGCRTALELREVLTGPKRETRRRIRSGSGAKRRILSLRRESREWKALCGNGPASSLKEMKP